MKTSPQHPEPSADDVSTSTAARMFALDTTRYLCAAVQMDSKLATTCIESIVDDKFRAVASSPGVDLETVLRYAEPAAFRQRARDTMLAILEVIFLIAVVATLNFSLALLLLFLLLAWGIVLGETLITYYGVLFPELRRESFDPENAPSLTPEEMEQRITEIGRRDRGNVTVFRDYEPFAGFGNVLDSWSFTINVAKAVEGESVIPFRVDELYDHVGAELGRLGLPGVSVQERLFVNGMDLLNQLDTGLRSKLLPDELAAPRAEIDPEILAKLRNNLTGRSRPYLTICVNGWNGQVVHSIFLRFAMLPQRDLLFAEATYTLLAPLKEQYTRVDRLRRYPSIRQVLRMAGETSMRSVGLFLTSLPRTVRTITDPLRRATESRRATRAIHEERTFNYGAPRNPRELAQDSRYHRYFQKLDRDMYAKTVEKRVMDALTEFLAAKNVDVSELIDRQMTILNHGIYIGGSAQVQAQSMAAGQRAMARTASRVMSGMATGTSRRSGPS